MSFATLLVALSVVCLGHAQPIKDDDAFYYNRLPDYKQESRNLDGLDGKADTWHVTLLGNSDQARIPEKGGGNLLRDLDMLRNRAAFYNRNNRADESRRYQYIDSLLGSTLGGNKRIAGCCLDSLGGSTLGTEKRNMDEIDRSSFNSFVKKNFDEIDRSGFGGFAKRNFDEIDRSGFGSFTKRSAAPAPDQPHN